MEDLNLEIDELDLDPENPRLPKSVNRTQEEMFRYVAVHGAIEELVESFVD